MGRGLEELILVHSHSTSTPGIFYHTKGEYRKKQVAMFITLGTWFGNLAYFNFNGLMAAIGINILY